MSYKQYNSPFNKSRLGDYITKYKRPKTTTYDPPPERDVLDKKADGSELVENESNKKAEDQNEGKGMNDDTIEQIDNYNYADKAQGKAILANMNKKERKSSIRKMQRAGRMLDRQVNKGEISEDDPSYKKIKEEAAWLKENKNKLGGLDAAGAIKAAGVGISNDKIKAKEEQEILKKEEERKAKENYEKNIKNDPDYNMQNIGPNLGNKSGGSGMYKQNDMDNKEISYGVKHLRSKGGAFPMVAQPQNVDAYGNQMPDPNRAGRGPESNQLTNNPNIVQPDNRIANSTQNTNQKFSNIASDAGTPHMPGTMPGQHKTGFTPAYGQPAFSMGRPARKIEYIENIHPSPMKGVGKNGPASFDSLVNELESEGKSEESAKKIAGSVANAKMEGAGSGPTAAQKARVAMYDQDGPAKNVKDKAERTREDRLRQREERGAGRGPSAYTRVDKGNVNSAEKDNAAHMDYLKQDINYDAKHGGSDKQMTDDEKHISKLAGDLKYDNYKKRKYDNTGSALSFEMQAPYKQIKYSHSFSDSPMNMGPFEENEIPMNEKTVAQDQSSINSVKKKKNGVIVKGTGPMGEKIKMKSRHGKRKSKLKSKF